MSTPIHYFPCLRAWGKRIFALPAILFVLLLSLIPIQAQTCATAGKDGTPTNALTGIVNTYYPGTATAAAGATSITLGTSRGATTGITSGDLLLVIQMQDAGINATDNNNYGANAGTGKGYNAANNTGRYEFVKATNTVATSGGTLNLVGTGTGSGLNNTYTNANATTTQGQRRFQVVRVPQYVSAALSSGLTAAAWNGATGGILALDVSQNLILGGTVSVDGLGFRGGYGFQLSGNTGGSGTAYRSTAPATSTTTTGFHAMKGEGFAGTPRYVWNGSGVTDSGVEGYPNGSMARGAPGNAGGGGTDANPNNNDENSGGGGGGNGGDGGIGGNSWTANTAVGGLGGDNFGQVSQARIVLGGGGGAGTRNNSDGITDASSGAAGGGIVIIRARKIQGTGTITANGASASDNTANDGAGGGGAGGSVIVFALSSTLTGLTVRANGGNGGDAWDTQAPGTFPGERHGPGGGGGGGVIYTSSTPTTRTVTAGTRGVTTTAGDNYGAANGVAGVTGTITAAQFPGVGSGADCSSSSAIDLVDFTATGDAHGKVRLEWKTGYETGNLGFNIYREADGKRTQINPSLIGGSAFLGGMNTPFTAGFTYSWTDTLASETYASYYIEDVDLSGRTTMHGPFSPVITDRVESRSPSLMLSQMHAVESPSPSAESVSVEGMASALAMTRLSSQDIQTQQGIAAKPGVKFSINQPGWYHISQPDLVAAGFDVTRDPRFMQLFANGSEIAMVVNGGLKGRLESTDSIEFYALGADTPWTSAQTYYLLNGTQAGHRVVVTPVSKGLATQRQSSMITVDRRDRFIYFSSLKNGDAENWFGSVIFTSPTDQAMTLTQVDTSSTAGAVLEVALQGITSGDTATGHLVQVQVNGSNVGSMVFSGDLHQVNQFTVSHQILHEGANTVTLTATGGNSDISLVDYLKLTYAHRFTADQNSLLFTASAAEAITIKGFTTPTVRVFDITDAANPIEVKATVSQQGSSYQATVVGGSGRTARVMLAVGDAAYQRPALIVANTPSTWSQVSGQAADEVIITHANFRSAADTLAQRRRGQGYQVSVVDVEDLYDEFSYGQRTPQAINDFLSLANTWKKAPKWVLLMGDASYDPKNYLGLGDNDFVPTKTVAVTNFETASDDWLADFTGDGIADMAIGRLPVRTAAQAQTVVNKIATYEQTMPTASAVLVADLPGDYDFEAASAEVKQLLPTTLRVQEIYRSQMDDATANQALIAAINRGPKLVNYAGHGSNTLWRGNILTSDNVPMLTNQTQLPVIVSMTCLNGLFNDPVVTSLGESLLLSDRGGAVAVWASSAQTVPGAQELMNQEMIRQLFGSGVKGSQPLTIGEAAIRAKQAAHSETVMQTWILLGDPLMKMR